MRQFRYEGTENPFRINCTKCKREDCDFEFTPDHNMVIYCNACGATHIVFKE